MSFLGLPTEIRVMVYKILLSPYPRPNDRNFAPSLRSYNIIAKLHPSILRVNKLISREAIPILYDNNTLILDLRPRFGNVQPINATQWNSNTREERLVLTKGGIYQQGLELVRHIIIKVDEKALWTEPPRMIRFTPGGAVGPESPPASRIKTSLLACLSEGSDSEEAEMEKKKTLKLQFILQRKRDGHVLERFLRGKHDEVRSEMNGVLSLAKAVKKRRNVEVELELKEIAKITDTIDLLKLDLDTSSRWGKRRNG